MTCQEARQLLHAYIDDELDMATTLQVQQHLATCSGCQAELDRAQAVRQAVAQPAMYYAAPAGLRARLQKAVPADAADDRRGPAIPGWTPLALAAVAALVCIAIGIIFQFLPTPATGAEAEEVLASHLRSLQADHLIDVQSTDQHTVKPWFAGKLDFSPPVIDLAPQGFPLVGGRLDYLDHQPAAALIYRHAKHVINLFIYPGQAAALAQTRQGFNFVRFPCRGMVCWAVSDLNPAELQQFADTFQSLSK